MKTIATNRRPAAQVGSLFDFELYPDSALIPSGKPLFLPEFAPGFAAAIAPVFRVSRLGKEIRPKFAPRYYDAVSLAARVFPTNSPIMPAIQRPDLVKGFDGAIVLGAWQPLPADGAPLTVFADGKEIASLSPAEVGVDDIIAAVSSIMTLKMGDLVMPCYIDHHIDLSVGLDMNFSLAKDSAPCLRLKIK